MSKAESFETVSQVHKTVIPGEPNDLGRDPWFDRLTTLSEVEGESRRIEENQITLDPPPLSAGDDEWPHTLYGTGLLGSGKTGWKIVRDTAIMVSLLLLNLKSKIANLKW